MMLMVTGTRLPGCGGRGPAADLGSGMSSVESRVIGSTAEVEHQQRHALDYHEMSLMFWCANGE